MNKELIDKLIKETGERKQTCINALIYTGSYEEAVKFLMKKPDMPITQEQLKQE